MKVARAHRTPVASIVVLFFAASLTLPGCQFRALKRDLEEQDKIASISGSVVEETPSGSPIAVAVFSDAMLRENVVNAQLSHSREFRLGVLPGTYFVFAFADENRDFDYQANEPAGYFGAPTPVVLGDGAERTGIEITLRTYLALPEIEGSGSARRQDADSEFPKLWGGRRNVGALATLGDRRFDPDYASMGMWQPLRFSLEVGPGLFILEPYDPSKTPVLFVHGLIGSPRDWQPVIDQLDRDRFQPWLLAYASGLPIDLNATYLHDAVEQLSLLHDIEKLYVVAHSMGGLVAKAFIDRYDQRHAGSLALFVTLSTPWGGHSAAQRGVDRAPAVVPAWHDMAPASTLLATLRERDLPAGLPYYLLFGFQGAGLPSSVSTDGTVTVASQLDPAAQNRARRIYGFDASHTGILSDESVILLLDALFVSADVPSAAEAPFASVLLE